MLIKINRQQAFSNYPIFPSRYYDEAKDEEIFKGPTVFANYTLTLPSKSFKGHQKLLGLQIASLTINLDCDSLIFLGDVDIAWLRRINTYNTFQESLQYLADNKIGKRFNGALQVSTNELPMFIKHLSWLVRTNGVLQYVYFTDPSQTILAEICQYGNLHISTKNADADKLVKDIIAKSQFKYMTDTTCTNRFSKNNTIKGRTIIV